jgi:hypothetical protein
VSGRLAVAAEASDNRGVERVELLVDGRLKFIAREPPFRLRWHSGFAADGAHRLAVRAFDPAGNAGVAGPIPVRVDNTPPRLHVNHPPAGEAVGPGPVRISGWALDRSGVSDLSFTLDGRPLALLAPVEAVDRETVCAAFAALADPRCPAVGFRAFFDPTAIGPGRHRLRVLATDAAGHASAIEVPFEVRER